MERLQGGVDGKLEGREKGRRSVEGKRGVRWACGGNERRGWWCCNPATAAAAAKRQHDDIW